LLAEAIINPDMIIVRKFILVCLPILLISPTVARGQDEARAAWQVTNFDLAVSSLSTERALNTHAVVSLRNVGRGAGSSVSLRLNAKAEIKAVSVGGVAAAYRATPEARGGALRISVTLPAGVAPKESVDVVVDYRLPVEENSGLAAISPLSAQFLPLSLWYPQSNTPFAVRGADTAPFRLTVAGASAIASGVDKSTNSADSVFAQSLSAMPFFVTATWDRVEGGGSAKGINAYLMKGAGADERKRADALMALAADARSFFTELLGPMPDTPIRLVAVARSGGFDDSGTVLLSTAAFRRSKIDAVTALTIAEAIARLKIAGEAGIHGEGYGVLHEGLARFLATLFFEKEFGAETAEAERSRQRLAYIAVAKRDAPLSRTTQGDDTYFNSVSNKGAMVWRLLDHLVGREAFIAAVRTSLQNVKDDPNGFNLGRFRAVLAERGGTSIKNVLDQQLDQPTDMDLMVGLPRLEGGQWISALRNLGSIEATVNVAAITDSGERVTAQNTIPAHDFTQVVFKTAGKIVRVEVDPEKFYPQLDFANDVVPHSASFSNGLGEATRLLGAQEYSKAEALAREMLSAAPRMQEARIVLARTLLGANRNEEAEKEFRQLMDERVPTPAALAWADIGMGEIALRRGQSAEAARRFNDAVREDAEYPSTLAARAARLRAESAANVGPAIDESAKAFIGQLDAAIRGGRKSDMDAMVMPGELIRFLRGLAGTPSEIWETRVLRTEQLDANRLTADVELHTKELGVEHSGTAVLILARVGGAWKLNAIEYFEVR
jgi:tetratricopeptide (TPR) repeat protein